MTSFDITKEEKFVNFVLDGTFTDNLGNYGYSKSNTTVLLNKSDVMRLEEFGKYTFQNFNFLYIIIKCIKVRNKQEQNSGVGENEIIGATGSLKELIGMKCTYAIKFLEDYYFWIQKYVILRKSKKIIK